MWTLSTTFEQGDDFVSGETFFFSRAAARVCGHDPFAQAHVDCPGSRFPGLQTEFFPDNGQFNRLHMAKVLSTTCRQLTIVETR